MDQDNNFKQKKLIIVAEDDKFYANIYRVKLTSVGYDVIVVGDGQQAIDAARKQKPDLILLDLIMPVKDGFEALREIRSDSTLSDVTVAILSSLGQDEDEKKAKNLGADDYFVKTDISIQGMIAKVKQLLELKK